ncbi:MAG: four helix bundle protein [Gemmatimonadota bacterium]|nr:four helix bundle protein [Gemmatimonadota bacterium]
MGYYRDLKAWQVAHTLALEVSRAANQFPPHERFELASRLRRAALSVPTNIAEGQARYGAREALRYTRIASGSLTEVDYLLLFAREKGYLDQPAYRRLDDLRTHAARLVIRLIRSLQQAACSHPRPL